MRNKLMSVLMVLVLGVSTAMAQTTPAPKPDQKTEQKAACPCCGDKEMKAGEGCCKDCPKDMSCCKHDGKTAAADHKMMCKDGKGCCTADCPMMKKSDGKAGCCAGNSCMEHNHSNPDQKTK